MGAGRVKEVDAQAPPAGTVPPEEESALLTQFLEDCAGLVMILDPTAGILWASKTAASVIEGRNDWIEALHPADRDGVRAAWAQSATGPLAAHEARIVQPDGGYRWVQTRSVPVQDPDGGDGGWIGAVTDIDDHHQTIDALRESELRLRLALNTSGLGIWQVDLRSGLALWTDEARAVAGVPPDQTINQSFFYSLVHPDDLDRVCSLVGNMLTDPEVGSYDMSYRLRRPDNGEMRWIQEWGRLLRDEAGAPVRIVGAVKDVTEGKLAEHRLIRAVNHDVLTGLLNRRALYIQLDGAIRTAEQSRGLAALLLIDIDDFKDVNDTLGHDAGDALLVIAADRFREMATGDADVGRLGGDEFAIVLSGLRDLAAATEMAQRVADSLAAPFLLRGTPTSIRASIGIACYPTHASDAEKLLKDADIALYQAKREGRNRVCLYTPGMRAVLEQRITLLRDVRLALDAAEFVPFYQPKVDLATGRILGFEALARWIHPARGVLTPAVFARAFDDAQLAPAIDAAMLAHIAGDLADWLRQGLPCGTVALNVSSFTLRAPSIVDDILRALAACEVAPEHLQVEVTESVFVDRRAEDVTLLLHRLRGQGIRISLDDFGTGYASLVHLTRFPVDEIKIDQSFVRDIEQNRNNAAIVSAMITLAHDLGLVTVAEGIERPSQAGILRSWGCGVGQGFLYSRPIPACDVPSLLRRQR